MEIRTIRIIKDVIRTKRKRQYSYNNDCVILKDNSLAWKSNNRLVLDTAVHSASIHLDNNHWDKHLYWKLRDKQEFMRLFSKKEVFYRILRVIEKVHPISLQTKETKWANSPRQSQKLYRGRLNKRANLSPRNLRFVYFPKSKWNRGICIISDIIEKHYSSSHDLYTHDVIVFSLNSR